MRRVIIQEGKRDWWKIEDFVSENGLVEGGEERKREGVGARKISGI